MHNLSGIGHVVRNPVPAPHIPVLHPNADLQVVTNQGFVVVFRRLCAAPAMPWAELEPLMEGGIRVEVKCFSKGSLVGSMSTSPGSQGAPTPLKLGETAIYWKT